MNPHTPTDRELLELAAKAAGIELPAHWSIHDPGAATFWNPLRHDGQALRLAVKLKLHLGLESHTASAWGNQRYGQFRTETFADQSEEAATRRAIVRAAADLGAKL